MFQRSLPLLSYSCGSADPILKFLNYSDYFLVDSNFRCLYFHLGVQLCMGSPVDKDLLKALYQEVSVLAQYVLDTDDNVKTTLKEFCPKINTALQNQQRRLDAVEETQKEMDGRIAGVVESSEEIIDTVSTLERDHAAVKSRLGNVEKDQTSAKHEMQGLKTEVQSLVLEVKSKDAEPSEICQLPNRNEYFSGREQELRTLEEAFGISESMAPKCKLFGISGLGGCGKTTLAVEYAWRCCSFYTGGIFWISAENEEIFRSTVMDMAFRLKTFRDDFDKCFSSTLATLSELPLPFLLVVDNADELELSNNVLKLVRGNWRQKAKCHMMITTRRKAEDLEEVASVRREDCVTLGCYSKEEGVTFMQKRTNMAEAAVGNEPCRTEEDIDAVKELVDELGGLPLALEQAGSHIKALKCTYSQYLLEFRKRKMKLIQQNKANPSFEVSRERLAVHTTWLMNFEYASKLAKDHGLEELTSVMVDLSGYLSPDDIPCDVINQAYTRLKENEEDVSPIDVATVLDILTKFSLYQMKSCDALSVHRLVQEVIRSRCTEERRGEVLALGVRMLDHAIHKVNSPSHILSLGFNPKTDQDVIKQDQYSLHTWARLASNAVTLESHVKDYVTNAHNHHAGTAHSLFTKENAGVLREASIYLSMSDQHKQALEFQKFMVETLTNIDPTESDFDSVELLKNVVSIPLTKDQQLLLRLCSQRRVTTQSALRGDQDRENIRATIVDLRLEGNKACAAKEYQRAISSYSEAIEMGDSDHDCTSEDLAVLYCNRCHCYLKLDRPMDALRDAEECVRKNPRSVKGFFRRAIAMKMLFDQGKEEYEMAYLASAAMAKYLDPNIKQEVNQKFALKNAPYTVIFSQAEWDEWIRTFLLHPHCQFHMVLLESGTYNLDGGLKLPPNSRAVLIGVDSVRVTKGFVQTFSRSSHHFENIVFDEVHFESWSSFVSCIGCTFENGITQEMPASCPIGPGCTGCLICHSGRFAREGNLRRGPASIGVGLKSRVFLMQCTLRNSASGALSKDDSSFLLVRDCKVHDQCLALLEARDGGALVAEGNELCNSKFTYGVTLGPRAGPSQIRKNRIHGNMSTGIGVLEDSVNITIENNDIYQNGLHGIQAGVSTSTVVRSNNVFENWFWGINVLRTLKVQLLENVVHHNKCGGIRLEAPCEAIVRGNKVSDHNGPGILSGEAAMSRSKMCGIEIPCLVLPVMEGNIEVNNVEGQQHPTKKLDSVVSRCAFCHHMPSDKAELKFCGKCRKSSYCSKRCQKEHWTRHRDLCKALEEKFSVSIDVPPATSTVLNWRVFHSDLKGIKKAPKPNRQSTSKLIVKIQTPEEVAYNPRTELIIYDQSTDVDFRFRNETVYHIVVQCGVLGCSKLTGKKIFCYAAFEANGRKLRIFLDELAPFQEW